MKKILLFLLMCPLFVTAQNNTTVAVNESTAEVLLLSGYTMTVQITGMYNDHITYTQGGKNYSLSAEQINKVTFLLNGQAKQYAHTKQYTPVTQTTTPTPMHETTISKQENEETKADGRIYIIDGDYMCNNTFISSKQIKKQIQGDPSAYKQWRKADKMVIGGWVCVGVGLGLAVGGLIPIAYEYYNAALGLECASLVPLGVGLGLTLGAAKQYQKAIDIYNSKFDHAAVQFKYNIAPNGFSVALAF